MPRATSYGLTGPSRARRVKRSRRLQPPEKSLLPHRAFRVADYRGWGERDVHDRHTASVAARRGAALRGYSARAACLVTFRELPCTFVPIIIDLDAGWTVAHREHTSYPHRFGSIRLSRASPTVRSSSATAGPRAVSQVDLTPLGARRLFGMPMSELANRTVPIDDVFGRFGRHLVQRVGDAPNWPAAIRS